MNAQPCRRLLTALIGIVMSCSAVPAQPQPPYPPRHNLRVGVSGDAPAVVRTGQTRLAGIAIAYWRQLATEMNAESSLVYFSSVDASLSALKRGRVDLAIGNITITSERISEFDFTEPVAQVNLTLLLPPSPPSLWETVRPFLGWAFLSSFGGIFLTVMIVGHLLWLAEHRSNAAIPKPYRSGVSQGIWCALVTFTTVGYGDIVPVTTFGRIISGLWMVLSIAIMSSLTAGIATTLALAFSDRPSDTISSPRDMAGKRIATIGERSAATQWADYYGARVSAAADLPEAVALLERKNVDGVLASRQVLQYYLVQHKTSPLKLAAFDIASASVGIALPPNSPLRQPLNEVILKLPTQIQFQDIRDNWQRNLQSMPTETQPSS